MRKFLIALLLSLSCSLTFAAVGCDSEDSSSIDSATSESTESGGESSSPDVSGDSSPEDSTEPVGETCKVVFTEGDGYFFEHEIVDKANKTDCAGGWWFLYRFNEETNRDELIEKVRLY